MKQKEIRVVKVSVDGVIEEKVIKNDLDTLYEEIGCRFIDVAVRKIGNKDFDLIVDDEGLLKENPICTCVSLHYRWAKPQLVGNVIICNHNEEGEFTSLTKEEIEMIMNEKIEGIDLPTYSPNVLCLGGF